MLSSDQTKGPATRIKLDGDSLKPYRKPRLEELGDLRTLTLAFGSNLSFSNGILRPDGSILMPDGSVVLPGGVVLPPGN